MSYGLTDGDESVLERAATMLGGDHSDTASDMLLAAMRELARHRRGAGASAREAWIKSLAALGETCISLSKRETKKYG